jgi:hypothetical protein
MSIHGPQNLVIVQSTSGALLSANNLSDLANAGTARTNLGLGSAAVVALDTDGTLAANSDTNVPSQKAIKTYADQLIAAAWSVVVAVAAVVPRRRRQMAVRAEQAVIRPLEPRYSPGTAAAVVAPGAARGPAARDRSVATR